MQWLSEHVLAVILFAAGVMTAVWLMLMRKRLQMKWYAALALSALHVLAGVLCVRVFARLEGAESGSMSLFGAVFFLPLFYFLGARLFQRPRAEVFDVFAIPMIFTLLCARINCLTSGCCLGLMIPHTSVRYPTREAEMVFYAVFLALAVPRVWKGTARGRIYPVYMAAYGAFRAVIECFRVSGSASLLHISHIWALLSLATGLAIALEMKTRQARRKQK